MAPPRLALFTRFPEPDKAKTRLIPGVGALAAAAIHRTLTERTVATLVAGAAKCPVEIHYTGADEPAFRAWLGEGLVYVRQPQGDLTARLLAALEPSPVIFFGADTPDLSPDHVRAAIDALTTHDVVLGPAEDGGYYLIGVAASHAFLFADMAWSTPAVLTETLKRLAARDIAPAMLPVLADCDRPEDLARWPWLVGSCV
ncbi:MAG: TIGR04282 family arsenosugar biosynthesis glycosyltransferase [Sphingomonas sp.]